MINKLYMPAMLNTLDHIPWLTLVGHGSLNKPKMLNMASAGRITPNIKITDKNPFAASHADVGNYNLVMCALGQPNS